VQKYSMLCRDILEELFNTIQCYADYMQKYSKICRVCGGEILEYSLIYYVIQNYKAEDFSVMCTCPFVSS
jgi:hypothetical protein